MSPDHPCLALLLDGPLQSWGHQSRFDHRTTALHPTRSGILGLVAGAMGIDKWAPDEANRLASLTVLRLTTVSLPRRNRRGAPHPIQRLVDYHTVTGIRRASGKLEKDATVQSYRHYLVDARFGVLLEGPAGLLDEIAAALRNPRWGVWLGRKSCVPACPILVGPPTPRDEAWQHLLRRAGYPPTEPFTRFDRIEDAKPGEPGAERLNDQPIGFGHPIGTRHGPRWIRTAPAECAPAMTPQPRPPITSSTRE